MRCAALLALFLGALAAGCELTEVTVADTQDVVIAEITLRTDTPTQHAVLHRTLQGDDSARATVEGARIEVVNAAGRIMTFLAAPDRDCIDNMPTSKHPPLGSCYVSDNRNQYDIEPGQTYTLRITLADGGVLTSSTRVPARFALLRPAITPCAVAANDTFSMRWTSSSDAWVYAGEAAIDGLQDILGAQGKKIDDPLRLFGLSASSRDTTILFPTEFGLFQRFDADLTDALVAISRGLPAGTGAVVTIAAADRNYVNWERGGDFNPSGAVRIPSIRGAGTGVFGSLVPHTVRIQAGASDLPGC